MMLFIRRILGIVLYTFLKNINLRFVLPNKYSSIVELVRTKALILQGGEIGSNSYIRHNVFVAYPRNLVIGNNVKVGAFSQIYNYVEFTIGDDTEIGPNLHVQTNEHIWKDKNLSLAKQGATKKKITIGRGVYIGANVTLLKGVTIDDLCVIAAGAVVVHDAEKGYVYGGVPAKKISKIM